MSKPTDEQLRRDTASISAPPDKPESLRREMLTTASCSCGWETLFDRARAALERAEWWNNEQHRIVDRAVQTLGGGDSLEDVAQAAAERIKRLEAAVQPSDVTGIVSSAATAAGSTVAREMTQGDEEEG
jgi:hypothetical protein